MNIQDALRSECDFRRAGWSYWWSRFEDGMEFPGLQVEDILADDWVIRLSPVPDHQARGEVRVVTQTQSLSAFERAYRRGYVDEAEARREFMATLGFAAEEGGKS